MHNTTNTVRSKTKADTNKKPKKGYKKTKLGWIPEEWEVITLGEIGDFKNGINKSKDDFGFGVPFINLMDVFGKPIIKNIKFGLVNATDSECLNYNLLKGDVLFIRSSVKLNGVGLTSLIDEELKNTVYSGFIIRYRTNDNSFYHKYKQYCFYETNFRNSLIAKSSTSANTNINQDNLKVLKIPIPPLPEQKKIANILSTWDRAINLQKQLITQKQALKKGLMQILLTGKKRFEGFSGEWKEVKVSQMFSMIAGKDMLKDRYYKFKTKKYKFPVYSNSLTNKSLYGFYDFYQYEENKITVTARGSLGFALPRYMKFNALGRLLVLTPKIELDLKFISEYINNVMAIFIESTGVPQLTAPQFSNYKLKTPNLKEQQKIAAVLTAADIEINKLQEQLNQLQLQKRGLMQVLLSGEVRAKV